jgi:predicted negative regulator of RcsB-dependent stress response
VQSYTRHQLKHDRFQEATLEAIEAASAHRQQLMVAIIVVLAIVLIAGGFVWWRGNQEDHASAAMGEAMDVYTAAIRGAAPLPPNTLSYGSIAERSKAAELRFTGVAERYSMTSTGKVARYMAAVAALEAGDYPDAESRFKDAIDHGSRELSSLAKLGLASVYHATNRDQDAIGLYNDLMQKPTESVSRERAQFALAALYENRDPAQAKKIYTELASSKSPGIAQIAKARAAALGK